MINQFRTVEDFISEESFQNFALKQDRASISRWQAYQKNHPEQDQLISEAIHFITLLAPPNIALSKAPENSKKKYLYLLALSACCIVLFCIWFFSLSANVNEPILLSKTAVTENLNLIFPDQTEVELRKGSTIEYYQDWSSSESRKLWLNGEAYFDVSKATNSKDVFEVQTDKALIKVLGTKFLIRCNDDHLEVILEEGKIEC